MSASAKKAERVEHANALIKTISDHGRRFFYNEKHDRVAHMSIGPRGHIYFHDDYTGKAIYTSYPYHWDGFSHGGTLRDLVCQLAEYVRIGAQINIFWIGPERLMGGNIWGYAPDEMEKCRAEALKSPVIKSPEAKGGAQ